LTVLGNAGANTLVGGAGKDTLFGLDGNDTISAGAGVNILDGGAGDDTLYGDGGNNTLLGGAGNDTMSVWYGTGDNVFVGGVGNDTVTGSYYSDSYRFNLGDGQDTIIEVYTYGGSDKLVFGAGIEPNDISALRAGNDMVFGHSNGLDKVTVKDWFESTTKQIEIVEFAGGTVWNAADLTAAALIVTGTAGDDVMTGTVMNDTLRGMAGNDTISAGAGVNILDGGAGDDTLHGDGGNNTLLGGAGNDTMSVWYGTGDNVFEGGSGNDTMTGSNFSDSYRFKLGDGQDTINETYSYGGSDKLEFGAGIASSDISAQRSGNDMVFSHANGADKVTVKDWFANTYNQIETVEFAGGTVWNAADLTAAALIVTGTAGDDVMTGTVMNDTLRGMAGNDTISAGAGVNILDGGAGDDTLYGDGGNNTLLGGAGNDTMSVWYGTGDNVFVGGVGNDTVTGSYYSDSYRFNLGDGQDTIKEIYTYGGSDKLVLGPGITTRNISALRSGNDMVFGHSNGLDKVIVKDWFESTNKQIETVEFAGGMVWNAAALTAAALIVTGTAGDDVMTGTVMNDTLRGMAGNDTISAGAGVNILDGGAGDDTLYGDGGNNTLLGGAGNDTMSVWYGTGDNVFVGGVGNDTVTGSYYSDSYRFNLGDGQDTIIEVYTYGGSDKLVFGAGIEPNDISALRAGNDMVFGHSNGLDKVTVKDWFESTTKQIEIVEFAGGTVWNAADLTAAALIVTGTAGDDVMTGTVMNDTLRGMAGNDTISAGAGVNILDGGAGDDTLYGDGGNNTLLGGAGNDTMSVWYGTGDNVFEGGSGNDTMTGSNFSDSYRFKLGDGQDTINETYSYGGSDKLEFGAGIASSDISAQRSGNDMVFSHANGADKVTVKDWFANTYNQIETVEFAGGTVWNAADLTAAAMAPLTGTDKTLTSDEDAARILGAADFGFSSGNAATSLGGVRIDSLPVAGGLKLSGISVTAAQVISEADLTAGNLVFTPADNANGNGYAAFNFSVKDQNGTFDTTPNTLTFNVTPVNDAPVLSGAKATLVAGTEGTAYTITQASLLTGFSDVDGNSLSVTNLTANNGTLSAFNATTGAWTFTPNANYSSAVALNYGVNDGTVTIAATQGFSLAAVNHAPVLSGAKATLVAGTEDTAYTITQANLLTGFSDADGNSLSVTNLTASNGTLSAFNATTGSWTFTPGANFNGTVALNYGVSDGTTTLAATQSFSLAAVNDAPTGNVTVSGTATQNQTLSAANTLMDVDGLGTLAYQWQTSSDGIAWSAISGATASTFTLTATQVGKQVRVAVSYLDGQGTAESVTSTATAAVVSAINRVVGTAGADTLSGTSGADQLEGLAGNDTYVVNNAGDIVIENLNEGTDLVKASVSYTLAANVENLTLTGTSAINGTGNTLNNTLTGNSGANVLDGSAGADTMVGGAGNDTYYADNASDVTTEAASAGTDTVVSSINWTLATNLENLTLSGSANITGTGNTAANVLTGNAGNNLLSGGTGADTMIGGLGNDTYVVDNTADVVTENLNEGTDLVNSSVTHTLSANVENLTLTGTTAINGTGNALDNVLTGNSAANVLTGGAGNDTYIVGTGDTTTEAAGAGLDTVQSSIAWTLANNVENLTLTGSSAVNGTGNTADNVLTGNSAANTLNGGAGADTMLGGAANDTYVVDNAGDIVTETLNDGTDSVQASVNYTLTANVENLTLTGTSALSGTGNTLNNTLTGNSGANVLDGGAGADTMVGGAGNDAYTVDNAGDVTTEAASAGTDTVVASINWTLATNLENLTLSGSANINGTGNTVANVLTGNAGDNVLDGGTGTDTLVGGLGNDTYVVDNTADVVTEALNAGTDLVNSAVTYTLSANVENLTLTGTTAINGTGNALDNVLTGNSAVNTVTGNAGNDTLDGKAGADTLVGGTGNDTYWLGRGYGFDSVTENDATAGNTDVARFDATVANDQLWFTKTGNNLEVSIIGTSDKLTMTNWYLGNQYHVEQFKTSNGKTLLDSQVQNLVSAMAAFAPPAAGQTTLSAAYATALNPVIVANWL
jgi:Ca2+-binding RTX toxin-like protein